jgi:hypothetical protein
VIFFGLCISDATAQPEKKLRADATDTESPNRDTRHTVKKYDRLTPTKMDRICRSSSRRVGQGIVLVEDEASWYVRISFLGMKVCRRLGTILK